MNERKCGNCAHVRQSKDDPLNAQALVCTEGPPTAYPLIGQGRIVGAISLFPPVSPDHDPCSRFAPKVAANDKTLIVGGGNGH